MPRARLAVLLKHSSQIDDDREPWRIPSRRLLILTCATIASRDDFDDIVAWGEDHLDFLRRFSAFGIPCVRWLRALVNRIDPVLFGRCFENWIAALWPDRHDLMPSTARLRGAPTIRSGQSAAIHCPKQRPNRTGSTRLTKDRSQRSHGIPK